MRGAGSAVEGVPEAVPRRGGAGAAGLESTCFLPALETW